MTAQVHVCDCLFYLEMMSTGSVDLTVTSPPYDNLRTYNGFTFEFEAVAKELYRVTKPGGVVVWNVADATINGSETGTSFRQALFFKQLGFNLHDTMIYQKANPIPQNHNRYEQSFEFMFVLTKGKPARFNGLTVPTVNGGKPMEWGKRKGFAANAARRGREESELVVVAPEKRRSNIWTYSVGGGSTGHPAVFPEALAGDHIQSWSNPGDLVFDPFTGSGTTGKMAVSLGRQFVGTEISAEYAEIASKRIAAVQRDHSIV
ncbi:COG0863 DNA modification methylase [uncultured Caudovirales phage]|uniref:site-specific DNA-methyltransferase (cytosine-N(4)-specific) n=1 Tax=uncultured Caudovirales phage TaxID=2100421 RepID=A0A6J7W516_9CAUD|nr:COG0863 DNA modification methylase [uncultured Caudovirales phage]